MCKEHTHLASTTGTSLPPAPESPELVHMRALEAQAQKDPTFRQKLRDWANRLTSIVL